LPKTKMRECSRNRSTTLTAWMFSLIFGRPGTSENIERTISLTGTPARLARYNALMISPSTRLLSLRKMLAWRPFLMLVIPAR